MTDADAGLDVEGDHVDDDEFDDDDVDDANWASGGTARSVTEYLVKSIFDEPDGVVVEVDERRNAVTMRVHVAPGDMGRVIGRRGRVVQAIRAVVRAAGARDGIEARVDVED